MAVSKANMDEKKPVEYAEGTNRAREARKLVAKQLAGLIEDGDQTGSPDYVALRIRRYAEAVRGGDVYSVRSALMELGSAVGSTVAAIDLTLPAGLPRQ